MGAFGLECMMETAQDLGFSRRGVLEWHILHNHFPSPPHSVIDIAEKAIELALEEDFNAVIQFSDFDEKFGDKCMSVIDIMDKLHLWEFTEPQEDC